MRGSAVVRAVVVSSLCAGAPLTAAADDIFLNVAGVSGDSVASDFAGWIEVTGMSHGVSFANKPSFQSVSLMVATSSASPVLEQAVPSARHFSSAAIWFRRGGAEPFTYLKITLTDVTVTSFQRASSSGGGAPTESIALSFARIRTEYIPQNASGGIGGSIVACWDLKNGAACQ